ncbi:MAG: hypothetical protein PHV30_01640 [Candidatus Margulisbacteria bacterium]|nr:hypothetical protein [Candidatus Margulisiibacteriota bacterium]
MDTNNPFKVTQAQLASTSDMARTENASNLADLERIFEGLKGILTPNNTNASYTNNLKVQTNINEQKDLEENVVYKPNENIVEQKEAYINNLEQDRLQKFQQKQILMSLRKEKLSGDGYSRNMDDAVVMNINKKDLPVPGHTEKQLSAATIVQGEDIYAVPNSSEEFHEEFIGAENNKNKETVKSKEEKADEQQEKDSADKQKKENSKIIQLENDEVLDLFPDQKDKDFFNHLHNSLNINDVYAEGSTVNENSEDISDIEVEKRILSIGAVLDKKDGLDHNLIKDIEKRIEKLQTFWDKKPSKIFNVPQTKSVKRLRNRFSKNS